MIGLLAPPRRRAHGLAVRLTTPTDPAVAAILAEAARHPGSFAGVQAVDRCTWAVLLTVAGTPAGFLLGHDVATLLGRKMYHTAEIVHCYVVPRARTWPAFWTLWTAGTAAAVARGARVCAFYLDALDGRLARGARFLGYGPVATRQGVTRWTRRVA